MKKFGVGLQLYSVRNSMASDFEGTLKAVSEMGYEYVEFAGYFGRSAEEIKSLLDKYGLKCVSVHHGSGEYYDFIMKDTEAAVKFLKTIGVKYYILAWYEVEKLAGTPDWDETAKRFNEVASVLSENGLVFGYHNHDFEFRKHDGKYLHDYIFEAVPEDKIVPELDTCWVRYSDIDPVDKIKEFKGRVNVVHLKDFYCTKFAGGPVYELIGKDPDEKKEDNKFEFRPVGYGLQKFDEILKACEECGTEYVIVEQDQTYDLPELEAVRRSREYLKNTFGI